jgi:hypothetical protein
MELFLLIRRLFMPRFDLGPQAEIGNNFFLVGRENTAIWIFHATRTISTFGKTHFQFSPNLDHIFI